MNPDTKTLDRLLCWLALYVVCYIAMAVWSGKPIEALPVISNLVSGFAGAAFAVMRLSSTDHGTKNPPKE